MSLGLSRMAAGVGCVMYLAPPCLLWLSMDISLGSRLGRFLWHLALAAIATAAGLHVVSLATLMRARRQRLRRGHRWVVVALVLGAVAMLFYAWVFLFHTDPGSL